MLSGVQERSSILIRVGIEHVKDVKDIIDIIDVNLQTKELGYNYWSTYTKSRIGGVQVTSLHRDPIGVDNRSLEVKISNNIKYKRNYIIKWVFSVI